MIKKDIKHDCFGNVIEVGDWAIYKNNQTKGLKNSRDWFEVGVVTKINDTLVTIESFVGDVLSPNWGENLREIRKLPYHICLFKKVRLPDLVKHWTQGDTEDNEHQ